MSVITKVIEAISTANAKIVHERDYVEDDLRVRDILVNPVSNKYRVFNEIEGFLFNELYVKDRDAEYLFDDDHLGKIRIFTLHNAIIYLRLYHSDPYIHVKICYR